MLHINSFSHHVLLTELSIKFDTSFFILLSDRSTSPSNLSILVRLSTILGLASKPTSPFNLPCFEICNLFLPRSYSPKLSIDLHFITSRFVLSHARTSSV